MKLSVVIVNYNVKYFLAQCLLSVRKAKTEYTAKTGKDDIEVFVVDNNSKDASVAFVKEHFPEIKLIVNKKNTGFSRANNQAIRESSGEYVLLLNPDTVIPEDTFIKLLKFADDRQDAGGIGVKMIDGTGNFLPESKRAFPSPAVSFYKIFGLSKLFPKSRRFGKYHLSYLDKNSIHKVDVLSGAFMLLRKTALDKTGLLDETFFMYGEDIDLSYRITKAGYANYYFPDVEIIHYKGESTKKAGLKYVYMFYNAMIIFAKKHFKNKHAFLFSFLIKIAIVLRAALSASKRIFEASFLPLVDIGIFYSGFLFIKPLWESYKFGTTKHYPPEYMHYAVPAYILCWLFSLMLSKAYKKPADSKSLFKGILSGTLLILLIYSLLNEDYRYSRMLLIAATFWAMFFSWTTRGLFSLLKIKTFSFRKNKKSNILFLTNPSNKEVGKKIFQNYFEKAYENLYTTDTLKNINEQVIEKKLSHLIISSEKVSYREFIKILDELSKYDLESFLIYPQEGFMLGAGSVTVSGELIITENFNLTKKSLLIQKRLFDLLTSIIFLALFPILILLTDNKKFYFKNIFMVLSGEKTWVGYLKTENSTALPQLKDSIFKPVNYPVFDPEEIQKINFRYARDYHIADDIYAIYKSFANKESKNL